MRGRHHRLDMDRLLGNVRESHDYPQSSLLLLTEMVELYEDYRHPATAPPLLISVVSSDTTSRLAVLGHGDVSFLTARIFIDQ